MGKGSFSYVTWYRDGSCCFSAVLDPDGPMGPEGDCFVAGPLDAFSFRETPPFALEVKLPSTSNRSRWPIERSDAKKNRKTRAKHA